jgi:predicted AlkP superfamily phosphohydrolase/phosphomutase
MKICVIGLDSATPELVFRDERLTNLRRLMDVGLYGLLQVPRSVTPISAWTCLATSQGPDSLNAESIGDILAQQGKKSLRVEHSGVVDDKPSEPKDLLREELFETSNQQWELLQASLRQEDWDSLHFVDFGLRRLQQAFSHHFDNPRVQHQQGDSYEQLIRDYYLFVDEHLGLVMEALDDQTVFLVASACGPDLDIDASTASSGGPLDRAASSEPALFLLAGPNCPISGEFEGATLFDMAPTLLDLAGYVIPKSMQGKSLVAGMEKLVPGSGDEHEKIIYDRLAGLGYV